MSKHFIIDDYSGPITAVMRVRVMGIDNNSEAKDELECNIKDRFMGLGKREGKNIVKLTAYLSYLFLL